MAKFAYNNIKNASFDYTLFELNFIMPWSCNNYVISTLYQSYIISILISISFFISNQTFNNYLFPSFYKVIIYFSIL